MPSSISSFSRALLEAPWGRTWLATAIVVVVVVGTLDVRMRKHGLRPTVEDSDALWAYHRDRIDHGAGWFVVVGSSRAQLGIDGAAIEATDHVRGVVQLAMDGSDAEAVLEDVATSAVERSTIVCELSPMLTFATSSRARRLPLRRIENRAHREAWRNAEVVLETWLSGHLVSMRPHVSPRGLHRLVRTSTWGDFARITTLPSRQRLADYSRDNVRAQELHWADRLHEELSNAERPVDIAQLACRLQAYVERLVARGNRVVFLRMPSSGLTKEAEDLALPRAQTWDRLAARVEAPFIHFEDEPDLREFRCAEGSHLDETTAREFTRALIRVLRRRGLLPPGA